MNTSPHSLLQLVQEAALLDKQYAVIYADPPWAWSKGVFKNRGKERTVEKEYPTISPEKLFDLPVDKIALRDSALLVVI